jgi:hypothetical protein
MVEQGKQGIMQQQLQITPKRNASVKSKALIKYLQTGRENALGLASLERARTVVWALWKILTDLLVGFGHLGLLFWLLVNCYRSYFL